MGKAFQRIRNFDPSWLGYLGLLGFLRFLYEPLGILHLFFPFFLLPLLRSFLRSREEVIPRNRDGAKAYAQYYTLILMGTFLNPFLLWQSLVHGLGQLIALLRVRGELPRPGNYEQKAELSLPFEGWWTVVNGGVDEKDSHSWDIVNQRYAYDFVITDEDSRSHEGKGNRLEDYYAFGKPVLAPADGVVVQIRDGIRDHPKPGSGWVDWRVRDFRGNFVVIRCAEGEYIFLAHLMKGSVKVKPGDDVRRGQVIGLCGNSGHSTEPHLHFHVQDHPNFFLAVSLPVKFADFLVKGPERIQMVRCGYISKGQQGANTINVASKNGG